MKKAILYGISLSLALSLTACGAPKEEAPEDTNTPAVTEPADTSTPESEKETNFGEPPVPVIYDIANDSNKDGAISKEEWEDWVAKHPEDKNQNMDLTDDVVIETPTPEPTPNPGTSSGNNNSGGTLPVVAHPLVTTIPAVLPLVEVLPLVTTPVELLLVEEQLILEAPLLVEVPLLATTTLEVLLLVVVLPPLQVLLMLIQEMM